MDKELKKQIKEDEFRSGLEHAWDYARKNRATVQTAGLAIFVAVAGLWAFSSWRASRVAQSEAELQSALTIFEAPVGAPPAGEAPTGPTYATEQDKMTRALAAFEGVEKRFGSTQAGHRARYFAALSQLQLGRRDEAVKTLEEIAARRGDDMLQSTLARLALASSYVSAGETDKGIDAYRKLADEPALPIAKDYVLMELGGALERAGRLDEARSVFKRVMDEFPSGSQAAQAAQRHQAL